MATDIGFSVGDCVVVEARCFRGLRGVPDNVDARAIGIINNFLGNGMVEVVLLMLSPQSITVGGFTLDQLLYGTYELPIDDIGKVTENEREVFARWLKQASQS